MVGPALAAVTALPGTDHVTFRSTGFRRGKYRDSGGGSQNWCRDLPNRKRSVLLDQRLVALSVGSCVSKPEPFTARQEQGQSPNYEEDGMHHDAGGCDPALNRQEPLHVRKALRVIGWRRAMTHAIPGTARRAIGIVGVILLDGGLALTQVNFKGGTLSQWNGLCSQGMGQVLGLTAQDCALAAHVDHMIGWMIGQGLALLAGYAILRFASRTSPITADLADPRGQDPDESITPAGDTRPPVSDQKT
jgi:hypothetical protein